MRRDPPIDGWNHNNHYHPFLLSQVPRPCARALDVGCGLGTFARQVARVAEQVDAIDLDPQVVDRAREHSARFPNLRYHAADFLRFDSPGEYDWVSFVATLHHLPFAPALEHARHLLRPGGVLAVLGLDRAASWLELGAQSLIAYPVSRMHHWTREVAPVGAPIADPSMTLTEIRSESRTLLPGSIVRRHLLWRYSLLWTKPAF